MNNETRAGEKLFARRIPSDEVFFSAQRFREWCTDEFGLAFTEPQIADRCQTSRNTIHALLYDRRQPTLNTLLRMAAAAGVSVERWLQHVVYKTGMDSDSGD